MGCRYLLSPEKGIKYHSLRAKIKYMFSFYGVIDLWAILPFYLPLMIALDLRALRMLRLLRIFRIFKLVNYSKSMRIIADVMREKKSDLIVTISVTGIILLLASTFMYEIEHNVQPEQFPNIFSTIWWAVATLTTIGYGDVYPITALGRLLAGITAVLGIGIVAIPTGIISAGFMEKFQQQTDTSNVIESSHKVERKIYYCPKCGTSFTVLDEDGQEKQ